MGRSSSPAMPKSTHIAQGAAGRGRDAPLVQAQKDVLDSQLSQMRANKEFYAFPLAISLTGTSSQSIGRNYQEPKGSKNCDLLIIIGLPRRYISRNSQNKVRKRAKYAKITRPVARARAPVKSSVDARKIGGRTSLIEVLSDPVRWMQTTRWCSAQVPSCRNCDEPAPPGTQWDWRCKCSPRLPQARLVCQDFPQTLSAAKSAVLIWCFNDRIGSGNAAKMAGVSRKVARGRKF